MKALALVLLLTVGVFAQEQPADVWRMFAHDGQTYIYNTQTGAVFLIIRQDKFPVSIMRVPVIPADASINNTLDWYRKQLDTEAGVNTK